MTTENTPQELMAQLGDAVGLPEEYRASAFGIIQGMVKDRFPAFAGSFAMCYGYDRELPNPNGGKGDYVVVLSTRGEKVDGTGKYAAFGGFMDLGTPLAKGEQPQEGAIRELMEEALDAQGDPVIGYWSRATGETEALVARVKPMGNGVDYGRRGESDTPVNRPPVMFTGNRLKLTDEELDAFKRHAELLVTDPDYRQAAGEATRFETGDVMVMRVSDAISIPRDQFQYAHEWEGLQQLAKFLHRDKPVLRSDSPFTGEEYAELEQKAKGLGVIRAIFALITPESERAIAKVLANRDQYFAMKHEDWMNDEGHIHDAFFRKWFEWTGATEPIENSTVQTPKNEAVLSLDPASFPFQRPTAGASEGIRAVIENYGSRARWDSFDPEVHIFNGEYEGYKAYAEAARIPVVSHDRGNWRGAIEALKAASEDRPIRFCMSMPSSIDGNLWPDYDAFMQTLAQECPNVQVLLDLTYIGSVAKPYRINANYPNVDVCVMSFSKPMGVYYNRVGGLMAREPIDSLFGHKWFLNMDSLAMGESFMDHYHVQQIPELYQQLHERAAAEINRSFRAMAREDRATYAMPELSPCDVVGIATASPSEHPSRMERFFARNDLIRVCTTPRLECLIDKEQGTSLAPKTARAIAAVSAQQSGWERDK